MTIVVPEPGEEELNDANWINWYVLEGHDRDQYKRDNKAFWSENGARLDDLEYEPENDWIAHMTAAGWTVKLAVLEWAV